MMFLLLAGTYTIAQTEFIGAVDSRSTIEVQDMTTGHEYSFETQKEVVVPLDVDHNYLISVRGKKETKQFLIRSVRSAEFLIDNFFDIASSPGFTLLEDNTDPFSEYAYEKYSTRQLHEDPGNEITAHLGELKIVR